MFVQGYESSPRGMIGSTMTETAKRAALITLVVGAIVVLALALWQLRLLVALLFLAFILAAAMRPTVEALARRGIPRPAGIALHYLVLLGLIAGFLWLVVPRAIDQVDSALGGIPQTRSDLGEQARNSTGIKHDVLVEHPAPARRSADRRRAWSTRRSR